jgi:hypothetical protein
MKLAPRILLGVTALSLSSSVFAGGSLGVVPYQKLKTISIDALYWSYDQPSKMIDASSVIVIGIPVSEFEADEHVGEATEDYNGSFYTYRRMVVQKVLKNASDVQIKPGDKITVVEPATIVKFPDSALVNVVIDDYIPMKRGWKYVLSMNKGAPKNWVIVNHNLGRMPYQTPLDNKPEFANQFNSRQKLIYKEFQQDLLQILKLK